MSEEPKRWTRPRAQKLKGLGDVVALVAQPIAKALDSVAGTKLEGCSSCKQRQATLNKAFPIKYLDS